MYFYIDIPEIGTAMEMHCHQCVITFSAIYATLFGLRMFKQDMNITEVVCSLA